MRRYKKNEWGIDFESTEQKFGYIGGFDERVYTDSYGNPITGILEVYYGFSGDPSDPKNCQYVENGIRKWLDEEKYGSVSKR